MGVAANRSWPSFGRSIECDCDTPSIPLGSYPSILRSGCFQWCNQRRILGDARNERKEPRNCGHSCNLSARSISTPGRIRTCDHRFRKPIRGFAKRLQHNTLRRSRECLGVLLGAFEARTARLGAGCRGLGDAPAGYESRHHGDDRSGSKLAMPAVRYTSLPIACARLLSTNLESPVQNKQKGLPLNLRAEPAHPPTGHLSGQMGGLESSRYGAF